MLQEDELLASCSCAIKEIGNSGLWHQDHSRTAKQRLLNRLPRVSLVCIIWARLSTLPAQDLPLKDCKGWNTRYLVSAGSLKAVFHEYPHSSARWDGSFRLPILWQSIEWSSAPWILLLTKIELSKMYTYMFEKETLKDKAKLSFCESKKQHTIAFICQ